MPKTFKPYNPNHLPWYLYDIYNFQLITTNTIPIGDITDNKDIILSETPIPGLNFNPINTGGMGNRKISFTIPLLKRNNTVGNLLVLKQFDALRNQSFGGGLSNVFKKAIQFTPNPKVLFFWGSGSSVPLEYYVKKCDPVHRSSFINRYGYPQYSEIQMELWLDETSPLFKVEDTFKKMAAMTGLLEVGFNIQRNNKGDPSK